MPFTGKVSRTVASCWVVGSRTVFIISIVNSNGAYLVLTNTKIFDQSPVYVT